MSLMRNVSVDLGQRAYDIHIGPDIINSASSFLPFDLTNQKVFIITDDHVRGQGYPDLLAANLKQAGVASCGIYSIPPGESSKSYEMLHNILDWLLSQGITRQSVIFTVGGGVVGDLGGFAASIILRGVPFVQVPTSLLAQVDSSVGGKTGINTPQGKNLVGTFYQPAAVLCDLNTLQTLPEREVKAGYAEIAKYALINDPEFFIWLEKHGEDVCGYDKESLAYAVEVSCSKKAEIVSEDENESGWRALLNLGHTFGHMLEAAAGYDGRLLHGEAVSIGMVLAANLSVRMGLLEENDAERIEAHLSSVGLPVRISEIRPGLTQKPEEMMSYLAHDKKATEKGAVFILMRGIGKSFISHDADKSDVLRVIEQSCLGK